MYVSCMFMDGPSQVCVRSGSHVNELLLLFLGHAGERVVGSGQVSTQPAQRLRQHALHLAALSAAGARRQAEPAHAAAGAHAARLDVLLVQQAVLQLPHRNMHTIM